MPANLTSTLDEHQQLLEVLPDLIDKEHITIDPGLIIIYYLILYHGCCLPSPSSSGPGGGSETQSAQKQTLHYLQDTYILALRSLPAWQKSAIGTSLDLNVAFMITRVAAEWYDMDLAFQSHSLACRFAEGLGIFSLDADLGPSPDTTRRMCKVPRNDAERRRFWDLVQYDVFLRLMSGRPSAISVPIREWRVNMPYLGSRMMEEAERNAEAAIAFLLCSRLTVEVVGFYQMIDEDVYLQRGLLLERVEEIAGRMQERYDEWSIVRLFSIPFIPLDKMR